MPSQEYPFPTNTPCLDRIRLSDSITALTPFLQRRFADTRFFLISGT